MFLYDRALEKKFDENNPSFFTSHKNALKNWKWGKKFHCNDGYEQYLEGKALGT